ncbi:MULTISPECIES: hypothetical protein [Catenuloplanes]|uniref:Uncharacterized protein n=1 Tax=Catenuloplanes niger TaxID=587534 RepID=A0AAE3ZHC8_9ACTN|nr:hypothetical protein [Catenuloplanes niger]MDR7319938.1 hypothetical protein [Catenuloplanes niger]
MTDELEHEVRRVAAALVESVPELDYSARSLDRVDAMLAEAAQFRDEMPPGAFDSVAEQFGCYVLEVGRREFGGDYVWHPERRAPVLVVGAPAYRVSLLTWDKMKGRLAGDEADDVPFFYAGFAGRARAARPGDSVLYV